MICINALAEGGIARQCGRLCACEPAMKRIIPTLLPMLLCLLLICLCARLPGLPLGPVPITLQSLAVILAGAVLGPWRGGLVALVYLLLGGLGAPVFAGGASGWESFSAPSAGYLLSFPLVATLCGALVWRCMAAGRPARPLILFACGLGSSLALVHPLGVAGLMRALDIGLAQALMIDLRFWPGDVLKNTIMALLATAAHRRWPGLRGGPASTAAGG